VSAKRKLATGAAAAALVAGGGAAVAASRHSSPREDSQAIINDAAKQLGIEPSELSDALKQALKNRVDAAVTAGRLSKSEGDALKERIDSGRLPLVFPGPRGDGEYRHHHGPDLDAAAEYLGLTEDELRSELRSGKSLAQIAKAHGRTVEGLVAALVDEAKTKLDAAVAAGRLTREEADSMLAGLKERITDLVNTRFPPRFGERRGLPGFRGGPPPLFEPPRAA
jgi:hypothetical protein